MEKIEFIKMQGAGNDFIMIDNRSGKIADSFKNGLAMKLCQRAVSIGADGLIFLENDDDNGVKWDFFNADGSSAEMCGNGARCFAVYAHGLGIFKEEFTFKTIAGIINASISGKSRAKVKLTDAPKLQKFVGLEMGGSKCDAFFINTGVPHAVVAVDDIEEVDIMTFGAALRYHEQFKPAGTNANFIARSAQGIIIRTYERGVEGETLACGTGSVAAAIVAGETYGLESPVAVTTRSGDILNISYTVTANGITDVYLEGPAVVVYNGVIEL